MKTLLPRYNTQRMVMDYLSKFYGPAQRQHQALADDGAAVARTLADWKRRVRLCWPEVALRLVEAPARRLQADQVFRLQAAVRLAGLAVEDLVIEWIAGDKTDQGEFTIADTRLFEYTGMSDSGEALFQLEFVPETQGLQTYQLRLYPHHDNLSHRFELGLMRWI